MISIEDILLDEQDEFEKHPIVELDDEKINGLIIQYIYEMMQGKISESSKNEMIDTLVYAYGNGYRHSYYSISNAIYQNINDSNTSGEVLESLVNNIQKIKDDAISRGLENKDVYKGIIKFYDHVMLEVTRINDHTISMNNLNEHIKAFEEEAEKNIELNRTRTWRSISRHSNRLNELMTAKTDSVMSEIEKLKDNIFSQLVAILGIFAAIIIVFFGGASIFAKVLEKIGDVNWVDVAPVLAITGFVMFNMVFMFLFVISRMIDKPINAVFDENSWWNKGEIRRWVRRYPYMAFFNALMIAVFVISIVFGSIDKGNNTYSIYESTEYEETGNVQ